MAFIDGFKKKAQDVAKGTKDLVETTRLNSQITDEQRKIGNLQTQIGKLYFETYGTEAEAPFKELCEGIAAANEQITKLQLEILIVKGMKRCPKCGADVPIASGFCGKCGSAVETLKTPSDSDVPAVNVRHCAKCNAALDDGTMFCGSCGQKYEEINGQENTQNESDITAE